ncbi:hypothetical protein Tco_1436359, partial [Tanacetum coccineum]
FLSQDLPSGDRFPLINTNCSGEVEFTITSSSIFSFFIMGEEVASLKHVQLLEYLWESPNSGGDSYDNHDEGNLKGEYVTFSLHSGVQGCFIILSGILESVDDGWRYVKNLRVELATKVLSAVNWVVPRSPVTRENAR